MYAMNDTLAHLHRIDPAAVSLDDYGRGENYVERQVARWARQYLDERVADRNGAMDRLVDWLPGNASANT